MAVEVGIGMSVLTLALVVLALFFELSRLHSQSGQQDDGEHSHAENDRGDPGNFDVGNDAMPHFWRRSSGSVDLDHAAISGRRGRFPGLGAVL